MGTIKQSLGLLTIWKSTFVALALKAKLLVSLVRPEKIFSLYPITHGFTMPINLKSND